MEQILKLNKQSDERHFEISSKIQMICNQQTLFSEQHSSMILELRKELEVLRMQLGSKDTPIEKQLVKPNQNVKLAPHSSEATTKQIGQIQQDTLIKPEGPELLPSQSSTSDWTTSQESNPRLKKAEFNSLSASTSDFVNASKVTKLQSDKASVKADIRKSHSTPSRVTRDTSPAQFAFVATTFQGKSKVPRSLGNTDTSPVHFALTAKAQGNPDKKKLSGHWDADTSSIQGSEEQDTSESYSPKNRGRNRFRVSSAPKGECQAACKHIQKALHKVPTKVSWDFNGDRTNCDLYVGNLDFNANGEDLFKSLRPYFGRVHVENVSILSGKGSRNR